MTMGIFRSKISYGDTFQAPGEGLTLNIHKLFAPVFIALCVLAGGAAVTSPAWAKTKACALYADNTTEWTRTLSGSGGRTGCGDGANVAVAMYEEIAWWPDNRLASAKRDNVISVHLPVSAGCTSIRGPYYMQTSSSAGSITEGAHTWHC
jgi:hypothetical protein